MEGPPYQREGDQKTVAGARPAEYIFFLTGESMEVLNGHQLYDAFYSGACEVIGQQDHLNSINVFPVPDGDTGTNLAVTLHHIMETTEVSESIGDTLASMSDAAITGARGNSGAIFAQFLSGLSEDLRQKVHVTLEHFTRAVEHARARAYKAMSEPKEGTILSVISDWARSLRENLSRVASFTELFQLSLAAAEASMKGTTAKLEVLRLAGVVDAGALGFYGFIQGASDFLATGKRAAIPQPKIGNLEARHERPVSAEEIRHRYCTEAILTSDAIDADALQNDLQEFGDSLIVAGGGQKVRVHIHTNRPAAFFERLRGHGRLVQQKVDDMVEQFDAVYRRKYPIALVTDSACDLPREILDAYQIHVVPLSILVDGVEYLDGLTVSPREFHGMVRTAKRHPTTSQPPAATFHRLYSYLSSHYDSIISIHLSARLSGTWEVSRREAAHFDQKKITVIDSRHLSGSLGLIVLRAAEEIAAGKSHEEVAAAVECFLPRAENLVSVKTLAHMVRGGRVSPLQGLAAKILNMKPIVSVDREGKSVLYGRAFSTRANINKILRMVADRHRQSPLRSYAVVHANAPERAEQLARRLREIVGKDPLYIMEISPIVSLNAGPGALSVVTMSEE
jgi:DegV family protein with EDD domain